MIRTSGRWSRERDGLDLIVVSPSLLEAATRRGGGIEEIDYRVGRHLSKTLRVALLGCFYGTFRGHVQIGDRLSIEEVPFPASRTYPTTSPLAEFFVTFVGAPLFSSVLALKLIVLLFRRSPELVIVHNGLPGLVAAVISKACGCKIIFSEGNGYPWVSRASPASKLTAARGALALLRVISGKFLSALSDVIRVQSNSIKAGMVSKGVNATIIRTIPGGVDVEDIKPSRPPEVPSHSMTVGYIGRLTSEKGAVLLREVILECQGQLPSARFVIFGSGKLRAHLENLVNVYIAGWRQREELMRLVEPISVFIFTQKDLGLAIIEMLASGKAVLALDTEDIREFINNGENGILCAPSSASYVSALKLLVGDPGLFRS